MNLKKQQNDPEFKSFESMYEFLLTHHKLRSKFKMIFLISYTSKKKEILNEFHKSFIVSKITDLYKIEKNEKETGRILFTGYLMFLPNNDSMILFSFSTTKRINSYFYTRFLIKNPLIDVLWITHKLTIDLLSLFKFDHNATLNYIKGDYSPSSSKQSKLRPDYRRRITYEGIDALFSYSELEDLYGINIEEFKGRVSGNGFHFRRKQAMLSIKYGDLKFYRQIGEWIFANSDNYLKEIRKFKKELYRSVFLNRHYRLSNNLLIEFNEPIPKNVFSEMINEIIKSEDIQIISKMRYKIDQFISFNIEFINIKKKGAFHLSISPISAQLTQIIDNPFISVFPVLDIIDYTQPKNKICVLI